jgi:putative intracellular protease/amidase
MQRGLEGRRVALVADPQDGASRSAVETVIGHLERAGATVHTLASGASDEDWHGAKYAALVLIGSGDAAAADPRMVQLVREFLVSDKPLAAYGAAVGTVLAAGGLAGRVVAAGGDLKGTIEQAGAKCVAEDIHVDDALITGREGSDIEAFASRLVRALSSHLEEGALDEMSDMSFPASDPPAVTPSSVGHLRGDDSRG